MTPDALKDGSVAAEHPAIPIGIPTLVKMAFDGFDLAPVWNKLVERVNNVPNDAAALLEVLDGSVKIAPAELNDPDVVVRRNEIPEIALAFRDLEIAPVDLQRVIPVA